MSRVRFIWTKRALDRWAAGKKTPSHTIGAPNIAEVYDGFVNQLKPGTPWALISADDEIIASGIAGYAVAEARL